MRALPASSPDGRSWNEQRGKAWCWTVSLWTFSRLGESSLLWNAWQSIVPTVSLSLSSAFSKLSGKWMAQKLVGPRERMCYGCLFTFRNILIVQLYKLLHWQPLRSTLHPHANLSWQCLTQRVKMGSREIFCSKYMVRESLWFPLIPWYLFYAFA